MNDQELLELAVKNDITVGIGSDTGRPRIAWWRGGQAHSIDMPDHTEARVAPQKIAEWFAGAMARAIADIANGQVSA